MSRLLLILALLPGAVQDNDLAKARALVQKLRSEIIEERDSARKALIDLGKAALPALREAVRDPDAEVARTVSMLLRRFEFLEKLTPRLLKHFPGVETRLAMGGDSECLAVLLEATQTSGRNLFPLTRNDLDPLAGPALRGTTSDEEFTVLCETIRRQKLKGAAAELRAIMKENPARAGGAAYTLHFLGLRVPIEAIVPLLKSKEDWARWAGVPLLEALGGEDAIAALKAVAADADSEVRSHAAFALQRLGDSGPILEIIKGPPGDNLLSVLEYLRTSRVRESIPGLLEVIQNQEARPYWVSALGVLAGLRATEAVPRAVALLAEEDIHIRTAAAGVLRDAGSLKEAGHLRALLSDPYVPIQLAAIKAAADWKARDLIADLRSLLRNKNSTLRQAAVEALGALRAKEAVPEILALLKDPDHSVGSQAIKVLASLDARDAAPALAGMLTGDNLVNEVQEALQELDARARVAGEQTKSIASGLKDPDPSVRWSVLRMLFSLKWRELAPEVARLLTDDIPKVRVQAIWTLYEMNAVESFEEIEKLMAGEGETAYPAFTTLCRLDPRRAAPQMRRFLRHENRGIRHNAIFGLAKLGDPEGLAAIEALAEDPGDYAGNISEVVLLLPPDIRPRIAKKLLANFPKNRYLADGLAKLADSEAQDRFAGLLDDQDPEVRASAVSQVLSMGRKEHIARVRKLIEDPLPQVRVAALWGLSGKRAIEAAGEIRERLFDIDPSVRMAAAWVVRDLRLVDAIPDLEELLSDEQTWVRDAAARVLGDFRSGSSIPRIKSLLSSTEPNLRSTALYALGSIGNREAAAEVAARLKDSDISVRSAAVASLALLKAVEYSAQIQELIRDREPGIRGAATRALSVLMGPRAIPLLIPLLEDPVISVRDAAARSLARVGSPEGVPRLLRRSDYTPWYPLYLLNGVRQPDLYSRLSELRFKGPILGSVQQVLDALLKPAGIALDDAAVRGEAWNKFLESPQGFDAHPGCDSVMYALQQLLSDPYDFVLEADRLRIISRDQAPAFWKSWWAEQQKTKR
jgi:HEAT repeat protein